MPCLFSFHMLVLQSRNLQPTQLSLQKEYLPVSLPFPCGGIAFVSNFASHGSMTYVLILFLAWGICPKRTGEKQLWRWQCYMRFFPKSVNVIRGCLAFPH